MPVKSQAQRSYLNMRFGHDWVKRHGFDQKGKLPMHKRRKKRIVPRKDKNGFY